MRNWQTFGRRSPKKKYLKSPRSPRRSWVRVFLFGGVALLLGVGGVVLLHHSRRRQSSSILAKIRKMPQLKQTDGRTNVLLLGLDRRSGQSTISGTLTDSIIVASVNPDNHCAFLVSLPRDLWVPYADSPYSGKINAVYAWGGIGALQKTIENILGLPIHYYAVVGFEGFVKAVDTIGGVTIDVPHSFDDYRYPIEGKENAIPESERYQHLHFDQGVQTMTGEQALQYSRSRHAQGDEGTDFARASRQQQVILAFKEQVLSHRTIFNLAKLKTLFQLFQQYIDTDISLEEALAFYDLAKNFRQDDLRREVLNGELFYNPQDSSPYNGAWVLVPKAGDFSQTQEFIKNLSQCLPKEDDVSPAQ